MAALHPTSSNKAPEGHSKSKTPEGSSKSKAAESPSKSKAPEGPRRYQKVAPSLYTDVRYMPPWRPSATEVPKKTRRSQEARQHASQQICDKATKKQSLQEEVGGMA